jgi:hypothetical protein
MSKSNAASIRCHWVLRTKKPGHLLTRSQRRACRSNQRTSAPLLTNEGPIQRTPGALTSTSNERTNAEWHDMPDLTYHQASESERQAGGMASRHCYAKDARQKMRDRRNNSRCADAKFRGLFRPAGKNPGDRKINTRRGPTTQCRSVLHGRPSV